MGSVFLDFLLSRIVYREMEGFCLFLANFLSSWVRNVIFPRNRSCNQKVGENKPALEFNFASDETPSRHFASILSG